MKAIEVRGKRSCVSAKLEKLSAVTLRPDFVKYSVNFKTMQSCSLTDLGISVLFSAVYFKIRAVCHITGLVHITAYPDIYPLLHLFANSFECCISTTLDILRVMKQLKAPKGSILSSPTALIGPGS